MFISLSTCWMFFARLPSMKLQLRNVLTRCIWTDFRTLLAFVPKQHLVMGMLFANTLIGPAYPVQLVTRISIINTFTCSLTKPTSITSRGSERGLGKLRLIVFIFITSTETNVTVLFVLRITIPTRWRMKSMFCFTARNMTPVDRNILISYWVIWVLRISQILSGDYC